MTSRIFIVMLRQPRNKKDARTDPFWENGSFGCTGCHGKNLLHPKNCKIADDDRLAFVQGGQRGLRLILVTPQIKRFDYTGSGRKNRVELRWDSTKQPFRYDRAPALFETRSPGRRGLFPRLDESLAHTNRSTIDAKFASRFRARTRPLEPELASELEAGFNSAVKRANKSNFIARYEEALPWCGCPSTASERKRDYQQLLRALRNTTGGRPRRTARCK